MHPARLPALAFCSSLALLAAAQSPQPPIAHTPFPTGTTTSLGAEVNTLLSDAKVSRAHWGIAVTELDGTPIYGLDEGKFFRPASNAKLFTAATAMALLGPEKRFTTQVVARGDLQQATLHGDLVLRGGGDANFAGGYALPYISPAKRPHGAAATPAPSPLADLDQLAARVAATGLKTVDGNVIGDDRYFEDTPYAEGWSIDDMLWGYGAPVSALSIHDNQIDLTVTAGANKEAPTITLVPDLPYYAVNNRRSGETWTPSVVNADFGRNQVLIERAPGTRHLLIEGSVAAKYPPEKDELAIDDPAEYAAMAFKAALEAHGVKVNGGVQTRHWDSGFTGSFLSTTHERNPAVQMDPRYFSRETAAECVAQRVMPLTPEPEEHVLAEHLSPPLAEDLTLTLKVSQNLHAEILLRNIAAEKECDHTLRRGVQLVREFALQAGVDGDDFVFYDGSGLSTKDLVTPRAIAQLLAYSAKQRWFPQWKAALPVGGEDGTLVSRFPAPPLKDHLFAKTGTLGETRALSGYLDCRSGKQVIFSVIVDDHTPVTSDERVAMDKIVAAIAANI